MKQITASFTGHRPQSLGGFDEKTSEIILIKDKLKNIIVDLIENRGIKIFISGGALGFDTWAAETIIELKNKYPSIKLVIAKPFPSQSKIWNNELKERYENMLSKSDRVISISKDPFSSEKMKIRNKFMVDKSSVIVSAFNGDYKTGTGHCLAYAKRSNVETIIIDVSK